METYVLKSYWSLMKPKILVAMLLLYLAPLIANINLTVSIVNLFYYFLGFIGVFASVGGANALNCYLDRDIDKIMVRTRRRPIPLGKVICQCRATKFYSLSATGLRSEPQPAGSSGTSAGGDWQP